MPELPEVETIRRGLALRLEGRRFAAVELRRPDLRVPLPPRLPERLVGRRIERVARRAKYVLIHVESGGVMILHLGMSGRLVLVDQGSKSPLEAHDHVVLTLDDGTSVRFNDARRFGLVDWAEEAELERHPLFAQ